MNARVCDCGEEEEENERECEGKLSS